MTGRPVDVAAIDELCRLALAAQRLGCRVQLVDVEPDLRDLLALAGFDQLVVDRPDPTAPPRDLP